MHWPCSLTLLAILINEMRGHIISFYTNGFIFFHFNFFFFPSTFFFFHKLVKEKDFIYGDVYFRVTTASAQDSPDFVMKTNSDKIES